MPGIASHHISVSRTQRLRNRIASFRILAVAAGISSSALFVVLGLYYELQLYGDGSIFSYSVAVQDAWAFHWHNIIGRVFVYLFAYVPAELYLELTSNAQGSIDVYGFFFFVAPLLGLLATFAADRSNDRIIFAYACLSTACLCPLVFGSPTETWMAHSIFWPALAVCHYARRGIGGAVLVFAALLALLFTHEGALIFAALIVTTLLLRGMRDPAFIRAASALAVVTVIWVTAHAMFPPDSYVGEVLRRAAWHVFDPSVLTGDLVLLLLATFAGYAAVFILVRPHAPAAAHIYAGVIVAVMLVAYWLWFDQALHADNRYYLRTVVLVVTPIFGAVAALRAVEADGRLRIPLPSSLLHPFLSDAAARAATGALFLVLLVHAVETTKFIRAWAEYKAAVRALATGAASDPALGDPRFVSSQRIDPPLNRLAWSSTTPFLSVLLVPGFSPNRLVVDPTAGYFWLSCQTATASRDAASAVPAAARELIRVYACLHR